MINQDTKHYTSERPIEIGDVVLCPFSNEFITVDENWLSMVEKVAIKEITSYYLLVASADKERNKRQHEEIVKEWREVVERNPQKIEEMRKEYLKCFQS